MSSARAEDTKYLLGGRSLRWSIFGEDLDVGKTTFAHGISQLSLDQGTHDLREEIDEHQCL